MKEKLTLMEVLIITAIIGVVSGVAIPRFMEARQIARNKALAKINYPIILEIRNPKEHDEIISALRYYEKYVNSRTIDGVLKRIKTGGRDEEK